MSESQNIEPYAVKDPDYTANILDEFVDNVEVECGLEQGIEEKSALSVFHDGQRLLVFWLWKEVDSLLFL